MLDDSTATTEDLPQQPPAAIAPVTLAQAPAITLARDTFKRLVKDVKDLLQDPLTSHGIYYQHNDDNFLTGNAMIIGPAGTPYADGFYFFKFTFPTNYPFAPPVLTYLTNDGTTRFNPNFYKTGKVCLSLLNTWKGQRWTACQTIRTILLVLCSTLNEFPLTNEPGILAHNKQVLPYNDIIAYKNITYSIVQQLHMAASTEYMQPFQTIMGLHFQKSKEAIVHRLKELQDKHPQAEVVSLGIKLYGLRVDMRFADVLATVLDTKALDAKALDAKALDAKALDAKALDAKLI